MTKQNTNMPSTPKINQPPYVNVPAGYLYYSNSPNYPSYPSSPQHFSNGDQDLSFSSLVNGFNNLNLQNTNPSPQTNTANMVGYNGAALPNNSHMMMPNYRMQQMMNSYPNQTVIPGYPKSIRPPSLHRMSMPISPYSTVPTSPQSVGFYGAQLTNSMMPIRSVVPQSSSGCTMPNCKHKIAQPYQPNNATVQGANFADENDMACVEVWRQDQERMLGRVKQLARTYKIVSLDTEFPGDPLGSNDNWREASAEEAYGYIKKNVDCSKIISLGWFF